MNKFIVSLVVSVITTLPGCYDLNINETQDFHSGVPESTIRYFEQRDECEEWYTRSIDSCQQFYNSCQLVHGIEDNQCLEELSGCGEKAFSLNDNCSERMVLVDENGEVCQPDLLSSYPENYGVDTDGDGLSDQVEDWMGLNPCHPCTYGKGDSGLDESRCDGVQDADGDGVPNAEDPFPTCPNAVNDQDFIRDCV